MASGQAIAISVLADTKPLTKGLGDAGNALGGLGKAALGIGAAVGAAVALIGVQAFKAVAEIERLNAQSSAAINSTGAAAGRSLEQIAGLADSLERMSGVEAEVIQGAQNMLLTFTQIKGDQFDQATKAALDMSVAMGTDMTSAATLVGKALNDPLKGIGALSKVGVQLTEDQKALVQSMVEVGDVAGAQGVILGVLDEQFGGSAEAFGGTFLGAIEKVKNSFGTLSEAFVTDLLPPATAALNQINDLFLMIADSPAFGEITAKVSGFLTGLFDGSTSLDFGSLFDGLLDAAIAGILAVSTWLSSGGLAQIINSAMAMRQGMVDTLIAAVPQIVSALVTAIPAIVTALTQAVPQLVQGAVTLFQSLLQAVTIVVPTLLAALIGMLPGVVGSILAMLPELLGSAVTLFMSLVSAIPKILPPLIQAIVDTLPMLIGTILGMIPAILDGAIMLFTALVDALPVILPLLIVALVKLVPTLVTTILGMIPVIIEAAVKLFTALVTAVPKILPELIPTLVGLLPSIVGAIVGMIPAILQAGVDLIGGLIKGLWQAASSVGEALVKIAEGAIKGFLSFLGIKSPSRLFAGYGKNLIEGLVGGLDGNKGLVTRSLDGLAATVSDFSPAPMGIALAPLVTSSAREAQAPTHGTMPGMVELSPYDRQLLADIRDSVGLTITERSLQSVVNGANSNAVARGAG